MSIYDDMQTVAREVLGEFDQGGLYYVRMTPGNGPADNPGAPTPTPFKLDAVARGVKFKFIDGVNIVQSDMQLTMSVRLDVTPDMNGFVTVDGVSHKVIRIDVIPPVGVTVAYRLFFRK